jgi:hypothetical protein
MHLANHYLQLLMMKPILIIIVVLRSISLIGPTENRVDPLETEGEKKYRLDNHHLTKPDSNYVEYWCSLEILKTTNENIETLNVFDIGNFLATFHYSCKTNFEFSKWSNELLFKVLNRYPNETLGILTKNNALDRSKILEEIESPINDGIAIEELIETLNSIRDDFTKRTKGIIIKSMQQNE